MDSLRNRAEAAELAEAVRASGRSLQAVLVTHGHPDHYIGSRTLDDFISAVDGERTDTDALARMKRLYPGFEQEGFLLAQSVAFHGPDARSK